jgi:O-antigen/teichoic acid export membrane protein
VIVSGLGAERFGVLALSLSVVASTGAFDLGLGRASARFIASAVAGGRTTDVPQILGTALLAEGLLGVAGGVMLAAVAPLLALHVFALPAAVMAEGLASLQVVGLAVPVVLLSSSLRAALSAAQRFDLVNAVVVPASSSMYLLPTMGVLAGWSLPTIVAALVASKVVALATLWVLTLRHCPGLSGSSRLSTNRQTFVTLLRFGSWVTVSSVMFPALTQLERMLIPALLSIGALTFYSVPYEAVSRAAILPVSMALTLFPAFSRFEGQGGSALTELAVKPMKCLLLVMTPALAFVGLFARELLTMWMGPAFALEAAAPLRILAFAFYLSGFSHILRAAVQGLGRPDLKAKLDLANAGLLLALLLVLVLPFGLTGAASARLIVASTELGGLFLLASRAARVGLQPAILLRPLRPGIVASAGFVLVATLAAESLRGSPAAFGIFIALTLAHAWVFWTRVADPTDRRTVAHLSSWLAARRGRPSPSPDVEEAL